MTWWLDVSCHYSYVRFCIDSENAFNMLPSRVIVDVTSCRESQRFKPNTESDKALVWRILPKSPSIWRHNYVAQVYSSYTWNCTNSERIPGSLYITMKQSYISSVNTIPYWRTVLCKRGATKVCTKHILDVNHKLLKNIMWPPTALSGILLGCRVQLSARRSRSIHDQLTDPKKSDTWNYYD